MLLQIATESAIGSAAVDFTWLFLKMLLALGIVTVSAILLLKYVVPKFGIATRYRKGKYFHVLGRFALEPKKHLYLVRIGKKHLVIGTADHGVQLLTEISLKDLEHEKDE